MAAQAATVAAHVPGATVEQTNTVREVTLLLGQDGRSVTAPTPHAAAPASSSSTADVTTAQAAAGCIY